MFRAVILKNSKARLFAQNPSTSVISMQAATAICRRPGQPASQCSIATNTTAVASEKNVKTAPVSASAVRARAWARILERMFVSCSPLERRGTETKPRRFLLGSTAEGMPPRLCGRGWLYAEYAPEPVALRVALHHARFLIINRPAGFSIRRTPQPPSQEDRFR